MNEQDMAERLFGSPPPAENTTLIDQLSVAPSPAPKADTRSREDRMFGDTMEPTGPQPTPDHAPRAPRTDEQVAEDLYGDKSDDALELDLPEDVRELRQADPDRRIFSPQQTFAEVLPDSVVADVEGFDERTKAAAVREFRELAADLGATPADVRMMRERSATLRANPTSVEDQRNEAVDALNRAFGQGAAQALRDARALVARDPRAAKIIDSMGLGDDPQTVLALAHAARRQRAAGKLK